MGNIGSYLAQSFPPKSEFDIADIPDLTGKIIIVTGQYLQMQTLSFDAEQSSGGNGGIGYETIKVMQHIKVIDM